MELTTKNNMEKEKLVCTRCEKDATELFECQRCTENVCDKCLESYNQFTQIDYDCCKSCAKYCDADYEP